MEIRDKDHQVLLGLAAARDQHEELADLLSFYYDVYKLQFEIKARLPEPVVRDDLAMLWRLEGGIPQLTFDQLGLEAEPFARMVARVMEVIVRYNPNWEAAHEEWAPARLMALAQEIFESWETLTAPKPASRGGKAGESWSDHPIALAVGFALSPHLQLASEVVSPHLNLDLWAQGHCPICGGQPNFALLDVERGARRLLCSRCNSLWPYGRVGCPFCKSKEKQVYYPSEDGVYRLYVCPACNRYLKTMDLREVSREVYPVVERLLTVGMDLAAHEEGYGG